MELNENDKKVLALMNNVDVDSFPAKARRHVPNLHEREIARIADKMEKLGLVNVLEMYENESWYYLSKKGKEALKN